MEKPKVEIVTIVSSYKPTEADRLCVEEGDLVEVQQKTDYWWYGQRVNGKQVGWFPGEIAKLSTRAVFSVAPKPKIPQKPQIGSNSSDRPPRIPLKAPKIEIKSKLEGLLAHNPQSPIEKKPIILPRMMKKIASTEENEEEDEDCYIDMNITKSKRPSVKKSSTKTRKPMPPIPPVQDLHQQSSALPNQEIVAAIAPYEATDPTQINLNIGDLIKVLENTDTGWSRGAMLRDEQTEGWYPTSYVKVLSEEYRTKELILPESSSKNHKPNKTEKNRNSKEIIITKKGKGKPLPKIPDYVVDFSDGSFESDDSDYGSTKQRDSIKTMSYIDFGGPTNRGPKVEPSPTTTSSTNTYTIAVITLMQIQAVQLFTRKCIYYY